VNRDRRLAMYYLFVVCIILTFDFLTYIAVMTLDSICYYAPDRRKGATSVAFVRPSVCPFVANIANKSRTQRPSMPKFGRKVPRLTCDSSFKVKRSKVRVRDGRGHTVSAAMLVQLVVVVAFCCTSERYNCRK